MENQILKQLGLNDKEIKIYLYLVKQRVQTVKQVAIAVSVNRTTTYRHLEGLIEKGLVEWVVDEKGGKVQTTSAESLKQLVDDQKRNIEKVESNIGVLISDLKITKPNNSVLATQVRYYKGRKGVEQMIWNTLSAKGGCRGYVPFRRREFIDPLFEDKFELEYARRKLFDRVITNEDRFEYINTKIVAEYKKNLIIRVIPAKKYYVTSDISIYNNIISIISFEKDNLVGVEIENEEMAKTQKSIFDLVWEIARSV